MGDALRDMRHASYAIQSKPDPSYSSNVILKHGEKGSVQIATDALALCGMQRHYVACVVQIEPDEKHVLACMQ